MSLNVVAFQGRLVAEPITIPTASGNKRCSFTLAVDRDYKETDGTRETDFIPCVAWNEKADFISRHFTKSDQVIVYGRMQVHSYESKAGEKRTQYEVYITSIYFCGPTKSQENRSGSRAPF